MNHTLDISHTGPSFKYFPGQSEETVLQLPFNVPFMGLVVHQRYFFIVLYWHI